MMEKQILELIEEEYGFEAWIIYGDITIETFEMKIKLEKAVHGADIYFGRKYRKLKDGNYSSKATKLKTLKTFEDVEKYLYNNLF